MKDGQIVYDPLLDTTDVSFDMNLSEFYVT